MFPHAGRKRVWYAVSAQLAHVSAIGGCASSGASTHTKVFDNAGLFDEIHVDLFPFLPGDGVRLFDHLKGASVVLEDPQASEGRGASHLPSRIVKE
jgi:hypothetical protein